MYNDDSSHCKPFNGICPALPESCPQTGVRAGLVALSFCFSKTQPKALKTPPSLAADSCEPSAEGRQTVAGSRPQAGMDAGLRALRRCFAKTPPSPAAQSGRAAAFSLNTA
jgi:hypothetical protein